MTDDLHTPDGQAPDGWEEKKSRSGDRKAEEESRSGDRRSADRQSPDWLSGDDECQSEDRQPLEEGRSGDRRSKGWHTRGYLPHFDAPHLIQHVTFHLADSLPKDTIKRIEHSMDALPENERKLERQRRLHAWIDAGHGSCLLAQPPHAKMMQDTLFHFEESRYHIHAWVVMPNHVHVLVEPLDGWALSKIVASWKKFSARKINDELRRAGGGGSLGRATRESGDPRTADLPIGSSDKKTATRESSTPKMANQEIGGPVWHREYWDQYMRDKNHLMRTIAYIHDNPVAAGLVNSPQAWQWSSAAESAVQITTHE
jgi:REP-associated tyrosine transposase